MANWNKRFLDLANHIASWSKDETKVGAVIIDADNRILSVGYNGFPSRANDSIFQRYVRPAKYLYTEHAERNAIYSAAKNGVQLHDAIIYINRFPCADCARAIIQSGIKMVVVNDIPNIEHHQWGEHFKIAIELFKECGVHVKYT